MGLPVNYRFFRLRCWGVFRRTNRARRVGTLHIGASFLRDRLRSGWAGGHRYRSVLHGPVHHWFSRRGRLCRFRRAGRCGCTGDVALPLNHQFFRGRCLGGCHGTCNFTCIRYNGFPMYYCFFRQRRFRGLCRAGSVHHVGTPGVFASFRRDRLRGGWAGGRRSRRVLHGPVHHRFFRRGHLCRFHRAGRDSCTGNVNFPVNCRFFRLRRFGGFRWIGNTHRVGMLCMFAFFLRDRLRSHWAGCCRYGSVLHGPVHHRFFRGRRFPTFRWACRGLRHRAGPSRKALGIVPCFRFPLALFSLYQRPVMLRRLFRSGLHRGSGGGSVHPSLDAPVFLRRGSGHCVCRAVRWRCRPPGVRVRCRRCGRSRRACTGGGRHVVRPGALFRFRRLSTGFSPEIRFRRNVPL